MKKVAIACVLFFWSCSSSEQDCDPVKTIFYDKSESYIEVFSVDELNEMSDSVRSRLCDDSYFWSELAVGDLNIPAEILPQGRCDRFESIGCFFGLPKTQIGIKSDTLYLNKKVVSLDSIESKFQKHFFGLDTTNYKKWQKQIVTFSWDSATSTDVIEDVLLSVAEGYSKGLVEKMARNGEPFNCKKYAQQVIERQKKWKRNKVELAQYNTPVVHPFLISISFHK